jgi:hypothetical protein
MGTKSKRLASDFFSYTLHLVKDMARLNDGHPFIKGTLTFTHTGFSWLAGDRLMRKSTNPDFSAAFDVTSHGTSRSFNLTGGQPTALSRLERVITEADLGATGGLTSHPAGKLLSMFNLLGH